MAAEPLETAAERSGFRRTSTAREVADFLGALARSELPGAGRLGLEEFGRSGEGRPLLLVRWRPSAPCGLKVLVNANIHGGEVEGKEAVQILLRELVEGRYPAVASSLELLFVPVFNPDGNDRIDRAHRPGQNGPEEGVGTRENAAGLDLNRDFVKAAAPETRALLALLRREDPQLFMDLHTTDGSYHGFHLTYAPSLAVNVDPALDRFARSVLLPAVRAAMRTEHGFHVYDYGNYRRRGDPASGWDTYDHRPRFGTNYVGLRNRLAILSEAYSHLAFRERVEVTKAFVLECLRAASHEAARILALCHAADARAGRGAFGYASRLEDAHEDVILTGRVRRVRRADGRYRIEDLDVHEARTVPVRTAFVATAQVPYPREGWFVEEPPAELLSLLDLHGVRHRSLAHERAGRFRAFEIARAMRAARPYQGHRPVRLTGRYVEVTRRLPAGTLFVPVRQPLARLAAQLLEPASEDSATTWEILPVPARARGTRRLHPVLAR